MPGIYDRWLDCVFYLYRDEPSATEGKGGGGTGLFVGVRSSVYRSKYHLYAVTNAHLIEKGFSVIRFNAPRGNPDSKPIILALRGDQWTPHPDGDDVSAYSLGFADNDFTRHLTYIPRDEFVTRDIATSAYILPGEDVFMVGRYINFSGKEKNIPSVRFGNISIMPHPEEKIRQPFRDHLQESFIVEMHSLPGYSGSPVFLVHESLVVSGLRKNLLGIDWGHMPYSQYVQDEDKWIDAFSAMTNVVPAWYIDSLLDIEEFRMERKKRDNELKRQPKDAAILDV